MNDVTGNLTEALRLVTEMNDADLRALNKAVAIREVSSSQNPGGRWRVAPDFLTKVDGPHAVEGIR